MTAIYRTVSPRRIASPQLVTCSLAARVVYHHLLVGECATSLPGIVRIGVFGLADEACLAPELVTAALVELRGVRLAEVDEAVRLIRLPGVAADHSRVAENPKNVLGWINALRSLPECDLRQRHAQELRAVTPPDLEYLWEPGGTDRTPSDRRSNGDRRATQPRALADRTKDQDQDQDQDPVNPPNPPAGGNPSTALDLFSDLGPPDETDALLAAVLDELAEARTSLTGVAGVAAPPSPRERRAWAKFRAQTQATREEILRAVRRAAESLRRKAGERGGAPPELTLAHVLRGWERLRDAHHLDHPQAHARAPPAGRRIPRNPEDPFDHPEDP